DDKLNLDEGRLYSFIVVRVCVAILSAAKNLKTQILRYAQDDKLNLDEGRLYSFIVVRVRVVILSAAKNL
ncbi:MAG: hypothetical protein WCY82_06645, partial [Desulfotomaculaceae bacterium]